MAQGDYAQDGYILLKGFFAEAELHAIEPILKKFHQIWLEENSEAYHKGAINSHSLTGADSITAQEKITLFRFIEQQKFASLFKQIFPQPPLFLNTQLFFDPKNATQQNYWHRDIQYTGISDEAQQKSIQTLNVVHFRIPFANEPGIELIPGTHRHWDMPEEYAVRKSLDGKLPHHELKRGIALPLERGDLLVFSANMIHRGLYGMDRFSLDIIYCDNTPDMQQHIDRRNMPDSNERKQLSNGSLFI